jgi:hypothetical protein
MRPSNCTATARRGSRRPGGDHRDEVLFAEHVRRAGAHAAHAGAPSAAFEALAAAADERARDHLKDLDDAIDDLRSAAVSWEKR